MAMWMHWGLIEAKWSVSVGGDGGGVEGLCGMSLSSERGEPFSHEGAGKASEKCPQGHVSPHTPSIDLQLGSSCSHTVLHGGQAPAALTKLE